MAKSASIEWLSKAIGQATRSATYFAEGSLPVFDPGLHVEGLGAVKLPLDRNTAKRLIRAGKTAPFGQGTATLVDKKVRNTWELDPAQFRLSDEWSAAIAKALPSIAKQLGLPAAQLEVRLYKLLVYEKGGFFLSHRDSEKQDRMVASLIVVLPNPFQGGALFVRHQGTTQRCSFFEARSGKEPGYAAFYADCEHEVERVSFGVRLCLAYNLVLTPKPAQPKRAAPASPLDVLADAVRAWLAARPTTPLVFALEHHYTQRGLSLELLKGADRTLADHVVAAAEQSDCLMHLAQVSRHLMQSAEDGGGYGRRRRSYRDYNDEDDDDEEDDGVVSSDLTIGETYEDDLYAAEWVNLAGKKQPWEAIPIELSAIVSSTPLEQWKPTSEEYEGYTGNAGNTLDRWYHRSAMILWHRDHHYDVIARSGAGHCVPLFCSMTAKLAKTPKKRLNAARLDCVRFARAITDCWPQRRIGHWHAGTPEKSPLDEFPEQLLQLHDRDTLAHFLSQLAERDDSLPLSKFIVAACREFGWNAFSSELLGLLAAPPKVHRDDEIPLRDIEWLSAYCCDKTVHPDKTALAHKMCLATVQRFCQPRPQHPETDWPRYHREPSASEQSLPTLLKALAVTGCERELSQVIRFVQDLPREFRLDDCQAPSLKTLVPWSQKQFGRLLPPLQDWLDAVRQHLESATAQRPKPPTDWSRPASVACQCQYCAQLNAFLRDPANKEGRIPAREDHRQHLTNAIARHQCDVTHKLERKGSPYSLVLTKTTGSFDRAVERFEKDQALLRGLPKPSGRKEFV